MNTIIKQLTEHAREIAQATGGKIPIEAWAWVIVTEDAVDPNFSVKIGRTGDDLASSFEPDIELCKTNVMEKWTTLGRPEVRDEDVRNLEKEASRLGFTLTKKGAADE